MTPKENKMSNRWIQNYNQLAITEERQKVLEIVNAGFDAISTEKVMRSQVRLQGNILFIQDRHFDLNQYNRVLVLGFGKASAKAAVSLERILGEKITAGIVISIKQAPTKTIQTFVGTHPLPSLQNVEVAEKMAEMVKDISEKDLVINLISGGGSALLCWNQEECNQGVRLYNAFLKAEGDIKDLNTVRKHLSPVKGGGLAKLLYPATVISLIFSDVAGDSYNFVDSGPTYLDSSTIADAKAVIERYDLGKYDLIETPKEPKYFEKVYNIPIVSNVIALDAMAKTASWFGLKPRIVSAELFETADGTLKKLLDALEPGSVVLAGSEIKIVVDKPDGKGGRNSYTGMKAFNYVTTNDTLACMASDGLDNSDSAGVILDAETISRARTMDIAVQEYLERFDGYTFFEKLGHELVFTGPTESNVSDFLVWYRK